MSMDYKYPFESFFRNTKRNLKNGTFRKVTLVIGNESCDLDSAVSSIVMARLLYWEDAFDNPFSNDVVVPILDVDREDYSLKTEIVYAFNNVGITADDLIFRDDIDIKRLVRDSLTTVYLVDHHILSERYGYLKPYVTHIIDHRPTDARVHEYKAPVSLNIKIVGSCATLIAERCRGSLYDSFKMEGFVGSFVFLEEHFQYAELLHSAIILDTANFSEVVKKGTPLDEKMVEYLERILKKTDRTSNRNIIRDKNHRIYKLSKLTEAKSDVSSLTAAQLLRKDAKIKGPVFLPGFPVLVEHFLLKPDALNSISEALKSNGCSLCILLGLKINNSESERDVAVYNTKNDPIAEQLSEHLQNWASPNLHLKPSSINGVTNVDYFKQMNLSASRKQYMPAVEDFIDKYLNTN